MKYFCRLVIVGMAAGFILASLSYAQRAEWKGKIETENGVNVIKNPKDPLYGELKLELQEDLSIGREDDKNYFFYVVKDISVDSKRNIYVVDARNYRIQKFDQNGKFLQTIGRQGQGPGEFQRPVRMLLDDPTGYIYVRDVPINLHIFDNSGNYVRTIHFKDVFSEFVPMDNESFMAILHKSSDKDLVSTHALCKVDLNGEITKTYAQFPYTIFVQRVSGGVLSVSTGFELAMVLSKLDRQTFLYGYSKDYEFNVINADGNVLYRIKKDEPRPAFTSKEKGEFKKIPIPENKPYFFSIFNDSEGRIYVQRNYADGIRGRGPTDIRDKEIDIFSKDGYFLYRTTLPANTCVIKDGFLYAYKIDEDKAMEYVKRYRIKNWDQIKKGI
ncbi:MAG: 6-bladed beta-propeller [Candidatus Aminicenantes bacterium]|nr:6-bladed beta-propeller [Candidatus Aminicenantes bacterium]